MRKDYFKISFRKGFLGCGETLTPFARGDMHYVHSVKGLNGEKVRR